MSGHSVSTHKTPRWHESWPVRYLPFGLCVFIFLSAGFSWVIGAQYAWLICLLAAGLVLVGVWDMLQTRHAVLRNYPVAGHIRYLLESIRPEIRQYFLESDNESAPFSRAQRSLVYQRAKNESDKRPFGTQLDVEASGYEWINHSIRPSKLTAHDFRIQIGGADCQQPYSASIFNISAMSFGSLSANAILALNAGAKAGGFAHDTGEGSISQYHQTHGGDLIWEIGSGYFGCRNDDGTFNAARFAQTVALAQVKMIELKLSQGAKPGQGGILPGAKVTAEIAQARGVRVGRDCISPPSHSAFSTPIGMLQFLAELRRLSHGKPVGFKFCVGHPWEWFALVKAMLHTGITPDFIVVDGAEGGTGAAPLEFTDHVGVPLQDALQLVHHTLIGTGLRERIKIGCAGKVISAFDIARMMALGADWCNSARGFMFALGCIQSLSCHTDQCPTGVATQDALRQKALHVSSKAERVHSFHDNTLKALKQLIEAAGLQHPNDITAAHIVRRINQQQVRLLSNLLHNQLGPGALLQADLSTLPALYQQFWPMAQADSFSPLAAA